MTKTALITGATGGLGRQFAKIHATNHGDLVLIARNPQKLSELENELTTQYHVNVKTIAVDFTNLNAAQAIFDAVQQANIKIDYLINNAGLGGQGAFIDRTIQQDMPLASVNMIVPTQLMKLFIPQMIKNGGGRILNVSSTAAVAPGPLQAEYYATKAYLTSLSNALWYELKDKNITVTTLMPGVVNTGFAKAAGLTDTKMFAHGMDPHHVAMDGYQGMLHGKLNVFSGLPGWQKPFVHLMPMMPKKPLMGFIASEQKVEKK